VQKMFPERKVFADHQCPDMGAVSYVIAGQPADNGPGPFLAVYGGGRRGPRPSRCSGRRRGSTPARRSRGCRSPFQSSTSEGEAGPKRL
jgi:hypothetical protein